MANQETGVADVSDKTDELVETGRAPGAISVDIADLLADLGRAADAVLEAGILPNTRAAFDQDWMHWERHCRARGVPPDTVNADLLVAFVAWLARGGSEHEPQAPSTIKRRLTGVLAGWQHRKIEAPHGITSKSLAALKILERQLAEANVRRGRGASPAVTIPQLRRMCAALPDTLVGHRDRVVLVVGFGIAARRTELATMDVIDVAPDPSGLVVTVRVNKTPRTVAVPPGTHAATDPVLAWQRWQEASGVVDGRALRQIHHTGALQAKGITGETVGSIVTRAGNAAGVYGLTGHSLRSGLATEARRAGHDRKTIAAQTGHSEKSAVLDGYMQLVDRWADNALTGIGL